MHALAKSSVLKRLKRIEGQVRGLARMVEDDRYCIDVVTQLSAVRAALRRAEEEILADHVAHCVEHAIASGNKGEQRRKVAELIPGARLKLFVGPGSSHALGLERTEEFLAEVLPFLDALPRPAGALAPGR